jgi:hypothetical protein
LAQKKYCKYWQLIDIRIDITILCENGQNRPANLGNNRIIKSPDFYSPDVYNEMLKRVERDVSKLHKIFTVDLSVDRAIPVVPCIDFQVTSFTD